MYYDLPIIGRFSLRGEYITGQQPGTASSSSFYNPASTLEKLDFASRPVKRGETRLDS